MAMAHRPLLRRLRTDRRGAAAVEFALLAVPFFLVVFALLQVALLFAAELVIDRAAADAGRMVRVGEIQKERMTREGFADAVCGRVRALLDCDRIEFDLRTYASFADVPVGIPMKGNGIDASGFGYDYGRGGTIVSLRLFYKWPILDVMRPFFASTTDGATILMGASTFRTEPF